MFSRWGSSSGTCDRESPTIPRAAGNNIHAITYLSACLPPTTRPLPRSMGRITDAAPRAGLPHLCSLAAGQMIRSRPHVNPTFDDPESFSLDIKSGVIRANIGDIGNLPQCGRRSQLSVKKHYASGRRRSDQIERNAAQAHPPAGGVARRRYHNVRQQDSTPRHETEYSKDSAKRASRRIAH